LRVGQCKVYSCLIFIKSYPLSLYSNFRKAVGDWSNIYVFAGTNSLKVAAPGQEMRSVLKVIVNEKWRPNTNDVALIHLDKPVAFSDTIRPVCLPAQNESRPLGRTCLALGWGRVDGKLFMSYSEH
jgi:hypothetical protein